MVLDDPLLLGKLARIADVFTPSQPVQQEKVFAGRAVEKERLTRALLEPGRHAIIYGPRGVGKTSLATITTNRLARGSGVPPQVERFVHRIPCTRDDDFDSLWKRVAEEIQILHVGHVGDPLISTRPIGANYRDDSDALALLSDSGDFIGPPAVGRALTGASKLLLIFDEYDRIESDATNTAFADTLKMLSDSPNSPTVVLVAVAADIEALVGAHESVERCTEQIHMSAMHDSEIATAIENGFALLDFLEIESEALDVIVRWARGFPSFAHAMAKAASEQVTADGRTLVAAEDVYRGALSAVDATPYSLSERFHKASFPRHPADRTSETLGAAAFAESRFRPTDLVRILEDWQIGATVRAVTNHCKALVTPDRGAILRTIGDVHPAYEFVDPMMIPYVAIQNWDRYPPESAV